MLSKQILHNVENSSIIRKLFIEGHELAARVGAENVCDFSLGNPVTPVPQAFSDTIIDLVQTEDSLSLHGYMDNAGYPEVRQAVAENLNKRFGTDFGYMNVIMTVGAASAINVVFKTILNIDDEVIVFAPYFGEYDNYIGNWYGKPVRVRPNPPTFQPDLEDFERKITPRTKAVILNNPNNPTGVVYSEATIQALAAILEKKQAEYDQDIYLVSDEPYRELVYDGAVTPFLTKYYRNTFVTYSFSKSLSIPGERIGYLIINNEIADFSLLVDALTVANRIVGYINAPSLQQKAVARCLDVPCEVDFYDRNRRALYNGLTSLGYECVKPEGAFYMFLKSPEPDEYAFAAKMKQENIIVVPGSGFGGPGYLRLAYCVAPEIIERSLPGFAKVAKEYGLTPKAAAL